MSQAQDNEQGGQAVPQTRTARHRRIVDILNRQPVRSQSQLAKLLADDGLSVTQATLSRDLDELGAVKIRIRSLMAALEARDKQREEVR